MNDRSGLLEAIATDQVRTWRIARRIVEVPPYLGFLDTETRVPWTSFAIPVAPVEDLAAVYAALEELRSEFAAAGRRVRFELFDRRLPHHPGVLEASGFVLEGADPVLALTRERFVPPAEHRRAVGASDGESFRSGAEALEIVDARGDGDRFLELVRASREAFGLTPGGVSEVDEAEAIRRDSAAGRLRCACGLVGGRVIAVASLVGVGATVELAGVGTVPEYRGRGAAAAVSARLIGGFFSGGGRLVWLTAGSEEAERVYRRLGFARIGANQLNYEDRRRERDGGASGGRDDVALP